MARLKRVLSILGRIIDGDPYMHSWWLRKTTCGACSGRGWTPGPEDYNGNSHDPDCDHCGGSGRRQHYSPQACSRCIPNACDCWCHKSRWDA
jgi:hypothetical protein